MYFYLSFLRNPPKTARFGEEIIIAPQIANDLRTELLEIPVDIYLSWQPLDPGPSTTSADRYPKPVKLTTFSPPSNTYKIYNVPLPKTARPGQRWRIGLSANADGSVDGALPLAPGEIIGVWSESIEILEGSQDVTSNTERRPSKRSKVNEPPGGKGKKSGREEAEKQTRITRTWKLKGGNISPRDRQLTLVEQTSFDLDKKIWDSGLAFSSWLFSAEVHPSLADLEPLFASEDRSDAFKILELGTGTGLASMALATWLKSKDIQLTTRDGAEQEVDRNGPSPRMVEILATDLDSAIPLIDENVSKNNEEWTGDEASLSISVKSRVLDWDEPVPAALFEDTQPVGPGSHPDLVLATDVTYNTSSFPSLVKILRALLVEGPKAPTFLLAYKQRDDAEQEFWALLKEAGIEMELVTGIPGHETDLLDAVSDASELQERRAAGIVELWKGSRISSRKSL